MLANPVRRHALLPNPVWPIVTISDYITGILIAYLSDEGFEELMDDDALCDSKMVHSHIYEKT
ncbi:MAG: hypothetical protein ABFS39_18725 [Pseudomonadota bacterium]